MTRARLRAALGLILGLGLLFGAPVLGPTRAAASAAGPGLTMIGAATYDVRPASRLVHVSVQLAATNHLVDTVIRRYTFDRIDVSVPPTAVHPSAVAGTRKVAVSLVSRNASQQVLAVGLGGALGAGRTSTVTLSFDLPDPGGSPGRLIRIGASLVTFPVWAYGSAGLAGSSVLVHFPAGYDVRVVSGPLTAAQTAADGTISVRSGPIADPLAFSAVVAADRPSAFVETQVDFDIDGQPASIVVRAWPDDPAWGVRMSALLRSSLPLLAQEIGLPFQPSTPVLAVEEALPRSIDGYAANYLPAEGRIQIAYTADDTVAIHELAHLWFDGSFFGDRWIADGFAIFYGNRVAASLKLKPRDESITPALQAAAIPLNAWTATGTDLVNRYGRAAAVSLASRLYELVGADGLQTVWRAASGREAAYQPKSLAGPSQVSDGPPDWRGLLDLVAERTGVDATSLWLNLVVTTDQQALLAKRAMLRRAYQALIDRAAGWTLPQGVLDTLNAWQFDAAADLFISEGQLLDQRDSIATAAAAAGLTPPVSLRTAFQQGSRGAAVTEAANELQVVQAISAAAAAEPAAPSVVDQVGLIGTDPEASLAAAATAFSAGDMVVARVQALAADDAWSQAADIGSLRIRVALAVLLVTLVLIGYAISQLRRLGRLGRGARHGRRPIGRQAGGPPARSAGAGRYPARTSRGTLADQPVRMARRVRPDPEEGDKAP